MSSRLQEFVLVDPIPRQRGRPAHSGSWYVSHAVDRRGRPAGSSRGLWWGPELTPRRPSARLGCVAACEQGLLSPLRLFTLGQRLHPFHPQRVYEHRAPHRRVGEEGPNQDRLPPRPAARPWHRDPRGPVASDQPGSTEPGHFGRPGPDQSRCRGSRSLSTCNAPSTLSGSTGYRSRGRSRFKYAEGRRLNSPESSRRYVL